MPSDTVAETREPSEKRDAIDNLVDMLEARDSDQRKTALLMKRGVFQTLLELDIDQLDTIDITGLRAFLKLPPKGKRSRR